MSISEEKFKSTTSYLLPFEKIHGLGNDFVVVNASHLQNLSPSEEQDLTRRLCDRNFGIGADGLIIIDKPSSASQAARSWRYYNSDGSVAEMCGNGIRCAAKYIYEHGLSQEESIFTIETLIGDISVEILDHEEVKVRMGPPREIRTGLQLQTETGFDFSYDFVSMGNPHAIAFYPEELLSWDDFLRTNHHTVLTPAISSPVYLHGPEIETHSDFPHKTNVEFASLSPQGIRLIVWERGCGFTKACGTGACATAVAAIQRGYYTQDQDIPVHLAGGELIIRWDSITGDIYMTGKAVLSFIGYYNDERA